MPFAAFRAGGQARMAIAKPEITIAHVEELFADDVRQLWSPATVLIDRPPVAGLRSPAIEVESLLWHVPT